MVCFYCVPFLFLPPIEVATFHDFVTILSDHPPGNSMEVTLMSYNILAQQYLNDCYYLYENCPSGALSWDYRSKCLLQEIKHHLPDVSKFLTP
jgi:mRNA deadenylase 3'-5' endonuclease subunit Ccr4